MTTEAARGRWSVLLITGVAVILSLTTWFSATAVLPELIVQFDLTPSEAAWLTNAVQLGFAVGALLSSFLMLSDIWPLTRFMAAAAVLAGIANLLLLIATEPTSAILARFLTGVALAGIYPPALKFIATWFVTGRGLAMGAMVGALTLGSAMPHLVRATSGTQPWEMIITACTAGCFMAALIFYFLLCEGPHSFKRTKLDLSQFGAIFRNRPVMLANLGYFGHMWELYALWGWFLAYATSAQTGGLALRNVSLLAFAVIAMGAPGCLVGGIISDRIGRCRTTMLMMGVSGSSALLIGFAYGGPIWIFVAVALIWGFSVVADSAQFSAAVSELSEPKLVGSSLAFQMGIGFAITILAIWLTQHLALVLGSWRWTFLLLVPGPLIGFFAMQALRRDERSLVMAGGLR